MHQVRDLGADNAPAPRGRTRFIVWMVALAIVFAGFVALGTWQVYRYHVRKDIAHALQTRVHAPPVAAPGPTEWPAAARDRLDYLHVTLHGRFVGGKQTLVHGSSAKGYGFWVMAPFKTARGFFVLVNRGYIPATLPGTPAFAHVSPPKGDITLTGLLRASEPGGGFMRPNQPQESLWYSRDVAAIATTYHLPVARVAPYFVDAGATSNAPRWPVAGLTKVSIYNESMGYAITWYVLALGTLLAAGIVIRHERPTRS